MANFPTLSINPEYPIGEEYEDSTLRSNTEGSYELTRARCTRYPKIFTIKYILMPDTDKDSLDTFVITVKLGADSFTWTHPKTSTSYSVRFKPIPKFTYVSYGYWEVDFALKVV